jgi:uncharacterized protein YjbI with pentapeptide repeats
VITSEQLESHAQWLRDGKGKRLTAVCADLRNADLRSADLRSADLRGSDIRGVNLRGAIGNMEQIKSAQFSKWEVVWTADVLAIGCQQHSIERWRSADSRWIAVMDNNATEWWERYRDLVFALIDTSPATGVVLEVEQ